MRNVFTASLAATAFWVVLGPISAFAQAKDACLPYSAAISSGTAGGAVPTVPDALLTNWRLAMSCVVPIIAGMKGALKPISADAPVRARFLSATGALRKVATKIADGETANNALPPEQRDSKIDTVAMFVSEFQRTQTIEAVSVLTTGARSDNYDMRLNSILILGNVIDERFTCVPLVQILDPDLDASEYVTKGRANLLGMLARVAPFVYNEDYDNIRRVKAAVSAMIPRDDPGLAQTNLILLNIDARLSGQTDKSNKAVPLQREFKEKCIEYLKSYPATDRMKANIKY